MRRYAKKILEIIHGFLLLSALYLTAMKLAYQPDMLPFYKGFLFLPVMTAFSILSKKIKKFWQFIILVILAETAVIYAAGSGVTQIGICVGTALAALGYFVARAKNDECWLEVPLYPWLLLYVGMYFVGRWADSIFVMRYATFAAGIYFLVYNFYVNLVQMDDFVETYADLERLPVKKLGRTNQIMMWMITGITIAAMFLSPYAGIEQIIRKIGLLLRQMMIWLFRLLGPAPQQEVTGGSLPASNGHSMGLEDEAAEASWLMQLLGKIMDVLGWALVIGALVFYFWKLLKELYRLYLRFNAHTEENGDRVERIETPLPAVKRKKLEKNDRESLFWDRSPNGRIRKYYKKKVLHDLGETPKPFWTPDQMEEKMELDNEEKECFHAYYEKARYGNEPCTREEMRRMLDIR